MSEPEDLFAVQLAEKDIFFQREYKFHPRRKWRADFFVPAANALVEVEGGAWVNGRHTRGAGFTRDCQKYNEAALLGLAVYRFTPEMVENGEALQTIQRAIECHAVDEEEDN